MMVACWAWNLNTELKTKWQTNTNERCCISQTNQPSTQGTYEYKKNVLTEWSIFRTNHVEVSHADRHHLPAASLISKEKTASRPAWLRPFSRFGNCSYGTVLLQGEEEYKKAISDWVTMFNKEDNPYKHRCETSLLRATLKLCHSYWRIFTLNRRYRTGNWNASKEMCYFHVPLKTEMTMWLNLKTEGKKKKKSASLLRDISAEWWDTQVLHLLSHRLH